MSSSKQQEAQNEKRKYNQGKCPSESNETSNNVATELYRKSDVLKRRRREPKETHQNGSESFLRSRTRSLSSHARAELETTVVRSLTRSKTRSLSPTGSTLEDTIASTNTINRRTRSDSDSVLPSYSKGTMRLDSVVSSAVAIAGNRPYMEDRHTVVERKLDVDGAYHFAGVYDGHGGQQAAEYAAKNLHKTLDKHIKGGASGDLEHVKASLRRSFLEIDDNFLRTAKEQGLRCGTTAIVSLVHSHDTFFRNCNGGSSTPAHLKVKNSTTCNKDTQSATSEKNTVGEPTPLSDTKCEPSPFNILSVSKSGNEYIPATLIMAHVGDSRAVLCRNGRAIRLTVDHKPNEPKERQRVQKAGGKVTYLDTWRVHHENVPVALSCARALGDIVLKEPYALLTADPDVSALDLSPDDSFIIIASDGVWDVVDDQRAVDLARAVRARSSAASPRPLTPNKGRELSELIAKTAAQRIVTEAVECRSSDNITAVVLNLSWRPCQDGP